MIDVHLFWTFQNQDFIICKRWWKQASIECALCCKLVQSLTSDWPETAPWCHWRFRKSSSPIASFHICPSKQSYRMWLVLQFLRKKKKIRWRVNLFPKGMAFPYLNHSLRWRLTYYKYAGKINNAYNSVKPRHWQGHRSMLFPAFAKIPNSPYLIKRLFFPGPCGWFMTPAAFMSTCFIFLSLLLTPKVIGILCFW